MKISIQKTQLIILMFSIFIGSAISQRANVDFGVRYNSTNCNYEAIMEVTTAFQPGDTRLGSSGFTIVLPASYANNEIATTSEDPSNANWNDNTPAYGTGNPNLDYHKFAAGSGTFSRLFEAGETVVLFTFELTGTCFEEVRVFNNGSDVNPPTLSFENSMQLLASGESYVGNIGANDGVTLPRPTAVPSSTCDDNNINLESNPPANYPNCAQSLGFSWEGPDNFTSAEEDPSILVTDKEAQAGVYTVTVTDDRGCTDAKSITVTSTECRALPVEYVLFTAKKDNKVVDLRWRTSLEINNLKYVIERADGSNRFKAIGEVSGAGTTSSAMDYSFEDESPLLGLNQYRLKQFDYNGTYEYSEIRTVRFNGLVGIKVFPNPTTSKVNVMISEQNFDDTKIAIIRNQLGQVLEQKKLDKDLTFDVEGYTSGVYLVQVLDDNSNIIISKKIQVIN